MHENPSLKDFTEHPGWSLINYKPKRSELKYDHWFDNNSFSEITYKFFIRRKPLFVIHNYVTPSITLCTLTLVSFHIPFAQSIQINFINKYPLFFC
jgi:hypothetical protein